MLYLIDKPVFIIAAIYVNLIKLNQILRVLYATIFIFLSFIAFFKLLLIPEFEFAFEPSFIGFNVKISYTIIYYSDIRIYMHTSGS